MLDIEIDYLSFDEKLKKISKFLEENPNSKKNICDEVYSLLKIDRCIKASSLPLNNYNDFIKIILIYF